MPLTLERTSAPATEPVSLTEAKNHLRVDISADDTLINSLVTAAREHIEEVTRRALITQTWKLYLDDFPLSEIVLPWPEYRSRVNSVIRLPRSPIQSVTSVEYVDTEGTTQTLAASKYRTDLVSEPARITEADGESWPTTDDVTNAVIVTYVAGYGNSASDVPQAIRQALLLLLGHFYENREQVLVGGSLSSLPMGVQALLAPYRVMF